MFGINGAAAQSYYSQTPSTFKAMQHLVMAMDDFSRSGKKSWFGRDKTMQAMEKVALNIGRTITAMRSDCVIAPQASAAEIHRKLQERLREFFEAFPTWVGAQTAAMVLFADDVSMKIIQTHIDMFPRG